MQPIRLRPWYNHEAVRAQHEAEQAARRQAEEEEQEGEEQEGDGQNNGAERDDTLDP